jgi:hypothetical protein
MVPSLQTFFGLTMPVSGASVAPSVARALVTRLKDATERLQQDDVPVAEAAAFRRDAQRYLALRRDRSLRLPAWVERGCDDAAHALMRLTANTPPTLHASERLVA